jgi:hypothetical protein
MDTSYFLFLCIRCLCWFLERDKFGRSPEHNRNGSRKSRRVSMTFHETDPKEMHLVQASLFGNR